MKTIGLYSKFEVTRTDGKSEPGQKHHGCEYLVLDMTHDPIAYSAVMAYAESCRKAGYHSLSVDLYAKADQMRANGILLANDV